MADLAFALDRDDEDRLVSALVERGHRVDARIGRLTDPIAALDGRRPDVLLVSADAERLTPSLLTACDRRGIRVLALASDGAGRRNAAALGLYDVVDADAAIEVIDAAIRGGVQVEVASAIDKNGTVLAVWGPAGAPGRTTVAICLATELAAAGHAVALVDADTHSASIAPILGMLDEAPGFAAACRLAGQDGLTTAELERIRQPYPVHGGTLNVLTGIPRAARWPELSTERVSRTIAACRDWADYVVIDTGFSLENDEEISSDLFAPRRNAATLAAVRSADRIVAVAAADPIGLARYLRAYPDLVEVTEDRPITTVVNKVRAGVAGLNPNGQVRATLQRFGGIGDPVLVPADDRGTDAALLAGRALRDVSPRSPALAAIARLARDRILPAAVIAPRRRALRRSRILASVSTG
ncbi:MinD-like ATPase involved in chromosome partitioning or flagellar assembly [Mycetocola sp. CAN_C7]|uniref:AAA family ATPase n=1 Tax=Mycetocola sp. CAN_C7 TaxID=2787724 RepID=UPI0018C98252